MTFEDALAGRMFSQNTEKTYVDKILAKEDIQAIRELIKKSKLTRSELLELLYLISATESKLVNYSAWDRYVVLKFFVWIREFIKAAELLYDYQDDLKLRENICMNCEGYIKEELKPENNHRLACACDPVMQKRHSLTERTRKLLDNNERLIEHNAKFLIDLYLNISRTSLSLGATGFMEMLKNKFEVNYQQGNGSIQPAKQEKNNWWNFGK